MANNDEIIEILRDSFIAESISRYNNCALVFAYNGTGKTRLSYDFAHYGRETGDSQHTLYYNAYTEDLFTWNNDIENETEEREHKLYINKNSALIQGLAGYDFIESLHKYMSIFTDIDFDLKYDKDEVPDYVVFSKKVSFEQELNGETVLIDDKKDNIKISRGEERLFVWCFFRCIMDQVIGGNDAYKDIEYIYIDDPMSSLDDNNVIAFAQQLYNTIRECSRNDVNVLRTGRSLSRHIKFIISTHHALFFHVMLHGLNNDKAAHYYLHRDKQTNDLLLKDMSSDTPFYYNVAVMAEVQEAIYNNRLFTYHFTIMRSVMEKIQEFFGHPDFRYILDGITYKGNLFEESAYSKGELTELYSRMVNVYSHQGSFFAPSPMNADNVDSLKALFFHIKKKYDFRLPNLKDERSEKVIYDEKKRNKYNR